MRSTTTVCLTACAVVAFLDAAPVFAQCEPQDLAKLIASDAAANDRFGAAVAIDGDTAIVGALDDDDAGTNSGTAYVFVRSGSVRASSISTSPRASGCSEGGEMMSP